MKNLNPRLTARYVVDPSALGSVLPKSYMYVSPDNLAMHAGREVKWDVLTEMLRHQRPLRAGRREMGR